MYHKVASMTSNKSDNAIIKIIPQKCGQHHYLIKMFFFKEINP